MSNSVCEICGDPSSDGRRYRGCRAAMANPPLSVDERPASSDTQPTLNTVDVAEGRRFAALANQNWFTWLARNGLALPTSEARAQASEAERDALKADATANAPFLAAAKHEQANICDLRVELSTIRAARDRAVEALRAFRDAVGRCTVSTASPTALAAYHEADALARAALQPKENGDA